MTKAHGTENTARGRPRHLRPAKPDVRALARAVAAAAALPGGGGAAAALAAFARRLAKARGLDLGLPDGPCGATPPGFDDAELAALPAESIGAVLEALLSFDERKRAGAFHTLNPLCAPTVERTLAPLLAAGAGAPLTICDPAVGGGAFLLAAYRLLVRSGWPREIALRSLRGIDLDPRAAFAARAALWIEAGGPFPFPGPLAEQIVAGDALLELPFPEPLLGSCDAVVGNPPWETLKPNSKEFFDAVDPGYRRLGRKEALARREELFAADPGSKARWDAHVAASRALGERIDAGGYRLQGGADRSAAKLFVERALQLLRPGGRLGLIVPGGIATERGSAELRRHLFDRCSWEWLYLFVNRRGIFPIHRSFRFGPLIAEKGGRTEAVRVAFLREDPAEFAAPAPPAFAFPRASARRLSPGVDAFVEVAGEGELELIERIYGGAVPVGERTGVAYRREFDLTLDARHFEGAEALLARGLRRDEFGRFADAAGAVASLPLYQGALVKPFDGAAVTWAGGHGTGSRRDWIDQPLARRALSVRFHVAAAEVRRRFPAGLAPRLAFRDVQNASNERTFVATIVPPFPCGNTLPVLTAGALAADLELLAVLSSFVVDRVLRLKMSQNHVNWFYVRELPLPRAVDAELGAALALGAARLALLGPWFAPAWLELAERFDLWSEPLESWAAVDADERLRLRAVLDALVARAFGLDVGDLERVVAECDLPAADLARPAVARALDPRGFWRVDRGHPPERRHPRLALAALADLGGRGAGEFLRDWRLPGGQRAAAPLSGRAAARASWQRARGLAERFADQP